VVDRLDRLRLNAFGSGDDEHGDVGHVRAAGAHAGKSLVAGRIDERDALGGFLAVGFAFDLHHPRGGVLRDAARLARGDVGVADLVEQAGFAVVDVAENRNDRRPRNQIRHIDDALLDFVLKLFFQRRLFLDAKLKPVFERDSFGGA